MNRILSITALLLIACICMLAQSTLQNQHGSELSYRLKTDGEERLVLIVEYSGDDKPAKGENYLFNICVDGTKIYTEGLNRNKHGLYEVAYCIPQNIVKGKEYVDVSFVPYDEKSSVGKVYAVEIVKEKSTDGAFDKLENWTGLSKGWTCNDNSTIVYTEPDGRLHPYKNQSVIDIYDRYALELTLEASGKEDLPAEIYVSSDSLKTDCDWDKLKMFNNRKADIIFTKDKYYKALVPIALFDSPQASQSTLKKIKSIGIRLKGDGKRKVKMISARLIDGNSVKAVADVYSKPGDAGETIYYKVDITNCEDKAQTVVLNFKKYGWEAFKTNVTPAQLTLQPGETKKATVEVKIPESIPVGGREKQTLQICPSASPQAIQEISFTSLRSMPYPFTIHTKDGWDEVRTKAEKYDWAKERMQQYIADADRWNAPVRLPYLVNSDGLPYLCATREENGLMNAAIAWQLTRDMKYAEKVKKMLLMISNPTDGYPLTMKASNQATVQEGHFFQHLAQAYDLIVDAGILSDGEHRQIEKTFRLYIDKFLSYKEPGGANWAVSQLTGVLFCALAIQDFKLVDEVLYAPSCLVDKFRTYTMPDGWWYECTVSYNLWVASEYIQIGLALKPFGYSLLEEKFPVDYNLTPEYHMVGDDERNISRTKHHGHSFRIRGPINQPYVTIKMMSDALLPFLDYRGWIFGINDATEREVGGDSFEMAYYAFRDPQYAEFIRKSPKRKDLIYGVAELPDSVAENNIRGAYADNAGALMLRSTQKNPRERIQAVLKYGTHGGYHGHFDRTGLLSLMRYGRSFYNPEMIWYSYGPFMYNFYVQSSISKNMVTVDLKQQEADDSKRTLFHTGDLFQAGCVEGTACWSYPAYGGLRSSMAGPRSFKEKTEWESRYFPMPENGSLEFGVLTGFTEPVMQRRAMVVTDDYVVIADYDRSTEGKSHRFDQLFQIKGLKSIEAGSKRKAAHDGQLSNDPLSAAPLITDVNRYEVEGTVKASFLTKFGKDADNAGTRISGEPGNLFMDVYNAWPNTKREVFTGRAPEPHGTERTLTYKVEVDGKTLAEGKFGAWILGEGKIDVDITGVKLLTLSTSLEQAVRSKTLFWAEAVIETADGKTIRLADIAASRSNVYANPNDTGIASTTDYAGGRINIAGNDYAWGLPAEPDKAGADNPATYTFNIEGLNATRLKAVVGGDYPLGNEAERRITFGITTKEAAEASYLTVIEPYETENQNTVDSVYATSANQLTVKLRDGREHRIMFSGMEAKESDNQTIKVEIEEWKDGMLLRKESTK